MLKSFLLTATAVLLLAMSAGTPVVAAAGCGLEPLKPVPPIGCADLVAQCVCDSKGNCHYTWICVKKR